MITMVLGTAVYLAAMQASVNVPRAGFSDCLKQANQKAQSEKVGPEAYAAFLRSQCTDQAAAFKNALVSFDVKNGIKRAQASSDADLQIDDYIAGSTESYQARFAAMNPKAAPKAAPSPAAAPPPPTPAAVPK